MGSNIDYFPFHIWDVILPRFWPEVPPFRLLLGLVPSRHSLSGIPKCFPRVPPCTLEPWFIGHSLQFNLLTDALEHQILCLDRNVNIDLVYLQLAFFLASGVPAPQKTWVALCSALFFAHHLHWLLQVCYNTWVLHPEPLQAFLASAGVPNT